MSLRLRLVLTVLALLALGLVGAGAAAVAAMRDYLVDRAEDQLTVAAEAIADRPDATLSALERDPELTRLWTGIADDGAAPSLFQLRDPDGRVAQTVSVEAQPELPDRLVPAAVTAQNPDGAAFHRIEDQRGDLATGEGDRTWRVRVSWLPDRTGILVVGTLTTQFDALIRRIGGVEVGVTTVALVGVGLLAHRAIRRGMRPLDQIADTARTIGEGDLTQRVAPSGSRTEVQRLGSALNAMLTQIESAFQEREASEQRLRRFIADASHELRTPIASIRGYAELFRRGAASRPDDLAMVMRRVEDESARMGLLVDELLLLARLDQGRPLDREPVELAALAADAVADARAVEPDRSWELATEEPVVVTGDAARLRQLLGNLLANVRHHTPATAAATVRVREADGEAVVEVVDSGPGLTDQQRERVFERFYRADEARARHGSGAGLGLSIVAAVAQAHGGRAEVESVPGGGATFRVFLPG